MAKQPRKPPRKAPPRIQRGGESRPLADVSLDALVSALGDAEADPEAVEPPAEEASAGAVDAELGDAGERPADDDAGTDEAVEGEAGDAEASEPAERLVIDATDDEAAAGEAPAIRPPADDSEADAEVEERRAAAAAAGVHLSDEIPVDPEDDLRDVDGEASPRLVSIVESLLFAAPRPLSVADLRRLLQETSKQQIQLALKHLIAASASRGVVVAQVAGGFTMRTHHDNATWVQRLLQAKPTRLSRSQLETLAIVAYRQPVTRPEIDAIRGVDSGAVLKVLLERELLQIVGKKDEPGRPLLYGTTLRFLEFFNLRSLRDLPTLRDFRELSEESKATVRSRIGEVHAEALGQGVLGLDLGGSSAVPEDMYEGAEREGDDVAAAREGEGAGAAAEAGAEAGADVGRTAPEDESIAAEVASEVSTGGEPDGQELVTEALTDEVVDDLADAAPRADAEAAVPSRDGEASQAASDEEPAALAGDEAEVATADGARAADSEDADADPAAGEGEGVTDDAPTDEA